MSTVIQNLMHQTLGDGARSSKFECIVLFNSPVLFTGGNMAALVKTAQFPGKSHDIIDFKYKGRSIPLKGQVKYDNTWTCTFYLTEDHKLKKGFEDWIESLDQVHNIKEVSDDVITAQVDAMSNNYYTSTMTIYQMDFDGRKNKVAYHMRYAYPKSVSLIEVDYSQVGSVLEYTVEFAYAYYDTENMVGEKENFVDEIKNTAMKAAKGFVGGLKDKAIDFAKGLTPEFLKSKPSPVFDDGAFKLNGSSRGSPNLVKIQNSGVNTYVS